MALGPIIVILVACLVAEEASSATIVATASGSPSPPTSANPFANGDFFIAGPAGLGDFGDGVDENTTWSFDFSTDPQWATFPAGGVLSSAAFSVTLHTKGGVQTDAVSIVGLAGLFDPFDELSAGLTVNITFDLLDFYTPSSILQKLVASPDGVLSMFYADDAIVSFARLELTAVPEPSSFALLTFGLLGMAAVARRTAVQGNARHLAGRCS